jgi:predicted GIY-YIG superfamily endonuclease
VYAHGKAYQYFRDAIAAKTMNDFQSDMAAIGVADPTGLVDGFNAIGYGLRGQYKNMLISGIAIVPYVGDSAKLLKFTKYADEAEEGLYSVYKGFDEANEVAYVGITKRKPSVRFDEHIASGGAKATLDYRVIDGATGLTKTQARVLEQQIINQFKLQKDGGQLLNKINSIAPKNWAKFGIE